MIFSSTVPTELWLPASHRTRSPFLKSSLIGHLLPRRVPAILPGTRPEGRKIIAILETREDDLDGGDLTETRKVVGCVHRHLAAFAHELGARSAEALNSFSTKAFAASRIGRAICSSTRLRPGR
ncbi:DUF3140 domain-containing protein [Amycolatopsis sp. NPDC049159]|uniref:DUF3140 domain-containing protein n=1 Tax=Amycolatopsis sp. NPDC049159 TaxID=3157210 RepID=UPI00340A39D8